MSTGLVVERRGCVGWLIFDRPEQGNAFDAAMVAALPQAWKELDADDGVGAIITIGRGRAFQTGLDMGELSRRPGSLRDMTRRTRQADLGLTGWHMGVRKPIIAAVNGVCAGGGLHFVVDADLVIASPEATFLDPHVSVGQASNWEAIGLTRRMAAGVASRLVLAGRHERLDAQRAYQLGLISEIVPDGRLEERAQELGELLAEEPAGPTIKAALWQVLEGPAPAAVAKIQVEGAQHGQ